MHFSLSESRWIPQWEAHGAITPDEEPADSAAEMAPHGPLLRSESLADTMDGTGEGDLGA
jgi:hypothetical protein